MAQPATLLIDADDTLWENNIYFERVAAAFISKLAEHGAPEPLAREMLWHTEQRNIKTTGYGSRAFCQSLREAARELGTHDLEPWIAEQETALFQHPIEFMPGVRETLPALQVRHRLILLTKGNEDEQLGKLHRSGLRPFFHAIEVVFEKSVETYRDIVVKHHLLPRETWMIGNSPRSDINPAKAAGLRTVFIPYHTTWQHEIEEISPNGETLILESFAELAQHFAGTE